MSNGAFTFGDKQEDHLPQSCMPAVQTWAEIVKTIMAGEIGKGVPQGGSLTLEYSFFDITLLPDGSFNGRRRVVELTPVDTNAQRTSA